MNMAVDGGVGTVSLALRSSQGQYLDLQTYCDDFQARREQQHDTMSWKLERLQHCDDPESESWQAFRRGDEKTAAALIDQRRDCLEQFVAAERQRGHVFCRVKVVERPFTQYMRWETEALRIQAECGMPVRVVEASVLSGWETRGPLPEVVILGNECLYEIVSDSSGTPLGAVRFTNPGLIRLWGRFVEHYAKLGTPIGPYLRCIARNDSADRAADTDESPESPPPAVMERVLEGLRAHTP